MCGVGEGVELWMGVVGFCPSARNDIVTPRHLFFFHRNTSCFRRCQRRHVYQASYPHLTFNDFYELSLINSLFFRRIHNGRHIRSIRTSQSLHVGQRRSANDRMRHGLHEDLLDHLGLPHRFRRSGKRLVYGHFRAQYGDAGTQFKILRW